MYFGINWDGDYVLNELMDNLVYKGELLIKDGYDRCWLDNVEYEILLVDCNENCNLWYVINGFECVLFRCLFVILGNFLLFEKCKKCSVKCWNRYFRKCKCEVLFYFV